MSRHVKTLFANDQGHQCLFLSDLVSGEAIGSNQLVIIDNKEAALFDPGGELTYTPLSIELSKHIDMKANLRYVIATHQDPDIITALPRWLMHTECKVVTSSLWARFLPHLVSSFINDKMNRSLYNRLVELEDSGGQVTLGNATIQAIPAHFLHSCGNFSFYDPVSKLLFSGDIGAAITPGEDHLPIDDMDTHIKQMTGFHQRYMASNRACRAWLKQISRLDIEMMVPQHGKIFTGKAQVNGFFNWFKDLKCGTDLM